jgi:hypothetical protein
MNAEAIVRKVDRLVVRSGEPEALYYTFSQLLLLPPAWPLTTNPFFTSAGIHLGNLKLEIMRAGKARPAAKLYGIAFQLAPYEHSLPALDRRGIPHTPPQPFYQVDDQGWQVTAWNSVFLGGLLGDAPAARLFFNLSRRAPEEAWEKGSLPTPLNRRLGLPFLLDTVYRRGMTYSIEYNPAWYALNIQEEPTHTGLDVSGVYEVCIGAADFPRAYASWQALLQPHTEVSHAIWKLPDALHLRLIPAEQDGLNGMTLQVHSLNRAVQFLNKRGMLGSEQASSAQIAPDKVQGLEIHLIQ